MRTNGNTITHSARTVLAVFLVALCAGSTLARAQTPKEIAGQIPLSVSDVIVGGNWGRAESDGAYRAVLVYRVQSGTPVADVIVQWVAFGENSGTIAHAETITSLTGDRATTAFIAFDFGETEPTTRLLIGSYNAETDKDNLRFVRLGEPGEFRFISPPESGDDAAEE